MYKCKQCKKVFDRKSNYERHINRKFKCIPSNSSKTAKKSSHQCPHCDKTFTRPYAAKKHLSICKNNNTTKIKGTKNVNMNGKNLTYTVSNNKNSNNNININLFLVSFAEDGIENISPDDLAEILDSKKNIIENIISNVNLNPAKPQHHNIYYPDIKSTYGEVYVNDKWIKKKIDEIMNTLLDVKIEDLNKILHGMKKYLNEDSINEIKEDINYAQDISKSRKKLISYIKPILYNNKDLIMKTRQLINKQQKNNQEIKTKKHKSKK